MNFFTIPHPSAKNPPFTGNISAQIHETLFEASKTRVLGVIPSALEVLISLVETCVGLIFAGVAKGLQTLNLFSEETNKKLHEIEFGGMFHSSLASISLFIHTLNIGSLTYFNNRTHSPFYQFTPFGENEFKKLVNSFPRVLNLEDGGVVIISFTERPQLENSSN